MQCEDQQQPASMQDGMVSDIVPATERNAVMEEEQIAPE